MVGLEIEDEPDFEEWMDYGQSLKQLEGTARQFAIGDLIVARPKVVIEVIVEDEDGALDVIEVGVASMKLKPYSMSWSRNTGSRGRPPTQKARKSARMAPRPAMNAETAPSSGQKDACSGLDGLKLDW